MITLLKNNFKKNYMDFKLLKDLQSIQAPAGDESKMKDFLIDYVEKNKMKWKVEPELIHGKGFQDCLILKFGNPRTAIFAHMDSIGFTVRYGDELVKLGGPKISSGIKLVGKDSKGAIETELHSNDQTKKISYVLKREIDRGTNLTFKPNWREDDDFIQNCYMDNRLGVPAPSNDWYDINITSLNSKAPGLSTLVGINSSLVY